ncbi:MAG: hypothetical protein QOH71_1018 [Blastocatellia bacterium]|nr:hypothetical protein [Blastocatellia bacterium]
MNNFKDLHMASGVKSFVAAILFLLVASSGIWETVNGQTPKAGYERQEVESGTFTVVPREWKNTDIRLQKGDKFRVVAKGKWKYKSPPNIEFGPNGANVTMGWFHLQGRVGSQRYQLGEKGDGTAAESGDLYLGAPAVREMGNSDEGDLEGEFKVTVFVTRANPPPKPIDPKTIVGAGLVPARVTGAVKLIKLVGDANCLLPGADWQEASEGMRLSTDDEIHTGPDSEATLQFPDGSIVVLKQMTRIKMRGLLSQENRVKIDLLLRMGELKAQVVRQDVVGSDFSVRTPVATTSVRGTVFTVIHNESSQSTTVGVEESKVLVTPTNSSLQPVLLEAGQQVEITETKVARVRPLEIDKGLQEPSLGTTLHSIARSGKGAAVGAIINADPLAGDWTGSSGAGGMIEEWHIINENGNWIVRGKWLRGTEEVGSFGGENYRYLNGHLTFTQIITKPPIEGWTSGTKMEAWAEGNSMTFRWTTANGNTGTVTHKRRP